MNTAKLINEGTNQVVVLPQDYQLEGDEVYIKKVGNVLVLISKDNSWESLWGSLDLFSDDFMESREQLPLQAREKLFE